MAERTVRYWPIPTAPDDPRHGGYGANRQYFVIYFELAAKAAVR